MKFSNYDDYKAQRAALIDAAQELLNDGKMEDFTAKTGEVEQLDNAWDAYAKAQALSLIHILKLSTMSVFPDVK